MEVKHIPYNFGSASKRSQDEEKRHSMATPKIFHDRSQSDLHPTKKYELPLARPKSMYISKQDENNFKCNICRKYFVEPRVLSCFHTFCTKCLQALDLENYTSWNRNTISNRSLNSKTESFYNKHETSSESLECESEKRNGLKNRKKSSMKNSIICPSCGEESVLPSEGVLGLPLHYILQHKMVLASLNTSTTHLLCDLCPSEVSAIYRCSDCAINLCDSCTESHKRQNKFKHEILHLEEARKRGINKIRRQIMCPFHIEKELGIYCSCCQKVVCRDCLNTFHKGHKSEPISRAAKLLITNMKEALQKVKNISKQSFDFATRLETDSKHIKQQNHRVQEEIETFIKSYRNAVEEHGKYLNEQLTKNKKEKFRLIQQRHNEIEKNLKDVKNIVIFTDELLREGTDVEILSFIKPILTQLDRYCSLKQLPDWQILDNLQFLPDEIVRNEKFICPLYGSITTQSISAAHCILKQEGLQGLRVGKKAEALLETRDINNSPLNRGGETIIADLRHWDAGISRSLLVELVDNRDGTYNLSFTPDIAGKLFLSVFINDQPIKDNPIPVVVRTLRPHHGTFHCCSFCSSGGSKEAACGCGGKMPGGYRGCGHGHEGHPGRRHWSCCGNVLEHSECVRAHSTHYQFTL